MKRVVWVLILVVSTVGLGCGDQAQVTTNCPSPPTLVLEVGPQSIEFADKASDPVPGFQRDCPFWIDSAWGAGTTNSQFVRLEGFKSVTYKPATGSTTDGWASLTNRTLKRHPSGAPVTEVLLRKTSTDGGGTAFKFPSANTVVHPRLMLFSITFRTAGGEEISIDPPWSEKKRR